MSKAVIEASSSDGLTGYAAFGTGVGSNQGSGHTHVCSSAGALCE